MNEIVIKGTQDFMGIRIPIVYGGFGEDQKCVLDKTIGDIHNTVPKEIRRSINRLIDRGRMKEFVDYIQLGNTFPVEMVRSLLLGAGVRTQDVSKAREVFALSERGYMKLIKAMDDDKSWDVMENFIDEYFRMKKHIIASPTLSVDMYADILKRMEERDQMHYDIMMGMFKSFESSMRNLAGVLLAQTNTKVDTEEMIRESRSNYTNKGKQYRAEVIDLCQQIVAISDFEDEKAVLAACYKHLTKNYGIVWEQEIREWKEQHTWSGKVSALNVVSESDDDKYLKPMLKNILMQILDDCKKKGTAVATNSELNSEEVRTAVSDDVITSKPNEMRISTYVQVEDFDSACELVAQIAEQSGDKSPYNAVTFMRIYKFMDDYANICWDYHERKFRQNHKFPKSARVSKKCMINASSKLQKLFVAAVNKYMEEIANAK